mmetsp:Transcript_18614/g.60164  ORF Transcript_18614/g.60164 Transcript_18614/m.60164 type:complete len:234 (-) Transcript_18614:261-962(-)
MTTRDPWGVGTSRTRRFSVLLVSRNVRSAPRLSPATTARGPISMRKSLCFPTDSSPSTYLFARTNVARHPGYVRRTSLSTTLAASAKGLPPLFCFWGEAESESESEESSSRRRYSFVLRGTTCVLPWTTHVVLSQPLASSASHRSNVVPRPFVSSSSERNRRRKYAGYSSPSRSASSTSRFLPSTLDLTGVPVGARRRRPATVVVFRFFLVDPRSAPQRPHLRYLRSSGDSWE